jgi:hypothetical protein
MPAVTDFLEARGSPSIIGWRRHRFATEILLPGHPETLETHP